MSYIRRSLEKIVLQVTKEYPVVLLSGPRQVGKTTMLKKLMEGTERNYVSLDDLQERELARTDPELFLQLHKPPILIDEVQYAPELFPYIKLIVDKEQNKGAFWLTGSEVFSLMRGVQESLAGRVALLSLSSLSQAEAYGGEEEMFTLDTESLLSRKKGRKLADAEEIFKRIFKGSMPAIVSGDITSTGIFYNSYLSTYIERDVKSLSDAIDSLKFLRFITALAARCSQMLNVSELARDAELNQKQVKDWLGILETLGIAHLTKWSSPETLASGAMSGAILENYVVSEIRKTYLNQGKEAFMYYYRDKDAKEIDLVLEQDGELHPIEIKKSANPASEILRVFPVLDKPSLKRGNGAVICLKTDLSAFNKENYIVPVWMI